MMVLYNSIIRGRFRMSDINNFTNKFTKNINESEILNALNINSLVIESTSRCNLKCEMCPRNSYKQENGDIDIELFKYISKYINNNIDVNLAGWGEPLLHPKLEELIKIIKRIGARVGFTTNATLLDTETSIELIKNGLDFIDFSLDGATQETYENIRHGSKFEKVILNIRNFIKIKEKLKSKTPGTSLTFVMMKKNIHELPLMVILAKELEIDFLVAKNFNVLTNEKEIDQVVFTHKLYNQHDNTFIRKRDQIIADSLALAKNLNMNLVVNPIEINSFNKCKLSSTSLFISHNGEVAVCCATGYPVPRMLNRKDRLDNAKIIYGNMNLNNLIKILKTKEYEKCRLTAASDIIPIECKGCLLSDGI